jgi:EAL domain-containing protein (putative c-di-GMP-specific phosphodiesterase class I)
VPIAEEQGLFSRIGEWVLHSACSQLRLWQQRGVTGLHVAVNVSTRELARDKLVERLRLAIFNSGIEPGQLQIEITEQVLMRHADLAARVLREVKELGAQVVLDDFGSGYSSLASLKRFPIAIVKVDRSLIANVPHDAESAALTRAVIAMAHNLGLQVTAEAVETREQWDFLQALECDSMQGNYVCAPAPAETLTPMLLQQGHNGVLRPFDVQQFRPWRVGRTPGA